MANTDNMSIQMADILDDVKKGAEESLAKGMKEVANEAVSKLKATSPKKTGSYAKGWRAKKLKSKDLVVHNATDYQLTHLLENGHIIRNKKGTYGRTTGIKHIKPVADWATDELPRKVMEELNDNL